MDALLALSSRMDALSNRTYLRGALYSGGVAALVTAGIGLVVSLTSGAPSSLLLEAALPTIRFLASSVATASATTLALLLTLLSLSANTEMSLDADFYRRVRRIAQLDVVAFVGAVGLLVLLVIPIGDETNLSETFYTASYYVLSGFAAVTAGLLVAVIIALYGAVHDIIETCWLDEEPLASPGDSGSAEAGEAEAA